VCISHQKHGSQVGLQTREPEVKHMHERKPSYYGHADENISDMIVADTAADIRRGEGIAGWWGTTKDTVSGWVGGEHPRQHMIVTLCEHTVPLS
jgi:hypothetical protein